MPKGKKKYIISSKIQRKLIIVTAGKKICPSREPFLGPSAHQSDSLTTGPRRLLRADEKMEYVRGSWSRISNLMKGSLAPAYMDAKQGLVRKINVHHPPEMTRT